MGAMYEGKTIGGKRVFVYIVHIIQCVQCEQCDSVILHKQFLRNIDGPLILLCRSACSGKWFILYIIMVNMMLPVS